jgi:pyroglutamyl-peptidase
VERTEEPIVEEGPDGYFSTLPVVEIAESIREAKIPAAVSNSAGTYLCNMAAYGLRHYCVQQGLDIPGGFIHVPSLPEQVAESSSKKPKPSMALEVIHKAVEVAVKTVLEPV